MPTFQVKNISSGSCSMETIESLDRESEFDDMFLELNNTVVLKQTGSRNNTGLCNIRGCYSTLRD